MNTPKLLALHTGVPDRCFTQADITTFYTALLAEQGFRRGRAVRAIMDAAGVQTRYSAIEADFFSQSRTTQERNDRYMQEAVPLGERVIREGLDRADVPMRDIDSLTIVSCTGLNVPGLDLLLAQRLGMSPHLQRTQVLGMGCYGAFPGIRRALDYAKAAPDGLALVLSLELCTLHLQFDDSAESIVSTSLFSDGAGMALIGGSQHPLAAPTLVDSQTYCDYQTLDHMSFNVTDHGFRMYLSSYVPDVLKANVSAFIAPLLARNGLTAEQVKFWAIHPGSKRIVEYLQRALALDDAQVSYSLDTLRDYGNMSSATVLFVLERMMQEGDPQTGDTCVMMAFGPGLTMEALLLRF